MSDIRLETRDGKINVFTPYDKTFVSKIKANLGGAKWNPEDRCWTVSESQRDGLLTILADIFGYEPTATANRVDIKVTFPEDADIEKDSIKLGSYTIASAWGRDSGVRLGDNVELIEGEFKSGGSVRYWKTVVKAGTTVICRDVPEGCLQKEFSCVDHWTEQKPVIEILDHSIDKEALEAEKAQLLKRLAEIESLLKGE